ncbi:MAG: hypothetical protein QM582_02210 [Micropruina sp.]|uniref:hypothetical protein n=1 Tax=Micropruina sp. TaxID=2737536 RepID=UPI0039E3BC9A
MSEDVIDRTEWSDVHRRVGHEVGVVLFTVLHFTEGGSRMERVYSSHPVEYPVGGSKDVATEVSPDWIAISRDAGTPYFGATPADLERIFADAELIRSLGCGSILNVPLKDAGGVTWATVNLCAAEGTYTPERIDRVLEIIAEGVRTAESEEERMPDESR